MKLESKPRFMEFRHHYQVEDHTEASMGHYLLLPPYGVRSLVSSLISPPVKLGEESPILEFYLNNVDRISILFYILYDTCF